MTSISYVRGTPGGSSSPFGARADGTRSVRLPPTRILHQAARAPLCRHNHARGKAETCKLAQNGGAPLEAFLHALAHDVLERPLSELVKWAAICEQLAALRMWAASTP